MAEEGNGQKEGQDTARVHIFFDGMDSSATSITC